MNRRHTRALFYAATFAASGAAGIGLSGVATATSGHARTPAPTAPPWNTPSQCIRVNGGDFNACNVGNGGSGDAPYLPIRTGPWLTPNQCILANGGDYNACNVGSRGRGDLPYKPNIG